MNDLVHAPFCPISTRAFYLLVQSLPLLPPLFSLMMTGVVEAFPPLSLPFLVAEVSWAVIVVVLFAAVSAGASPFSVLVAAFSIAAAVPP